MHPNKTFCCSIRAFLLSLLSFNSTSNSLLWSRLSFSPISSSVCLSSSLRVEGPLGPTPLTSVSASDSSTHALLCNHFPESSGCRPELHPTQCIRPSTRSRGHMTSGVLPQLARRNTAYGTDTGCTH